MQNLKLFLLTLVIATFTQAQSLRCEFLFKASREAQQAIALKLARLRLDTYALGVDQKR